MPRPRRRLFPGFQSTHPVRGATNKARTPLVPTLISIHAPREGCDLATAPPNRSGSISIHAPREGCDVLFRCLRPVAEISIHAPREGCDARPASPCTTTSSFQSTHPVRGATCCELTSMVSYSQFQSTHPVRGATDGPIHRRRHQAISIHAPREGCDRPWSKDSGNARYFNPRTP